MTKIALRDLNKKGYYLEEVKYQDNKKVFEIVKDIDKDTKKFLGTVCFRTGKKMSKIFNLKIQEAKKIIIPLNGRTLPEENKIII